MGTQKNMRAVRKAIVEAGGTIVGVSKGKHYKFKIDFGSGVRTLVCSSSPSDGYAVENMVRDIERMKEGSG